MSSERTVNNSLYVVILAAGKGTRMRSRLPKVLQPLAHLSLLEHVVRTAQTLNPAKIIVIYGHGGDVVLSGLKHLNVQWVEQTNLIGTGDAVAQAVPHIPSGAKVLVLYGDVPLTPTATLQSLVERVTTEQPLALLTAKLDDPTGYGRIIRNNVGEVLYIVEHKDANADQRRVDEVNTGILAAQRDRLAAWLARVENNNAQGEYYLTDVTGLAVKDGVRVSTASTTQLWEILGVNDKAQLAELERQYQRNRAAALMAAGVTLRDPSRLECRGDISVGQDVEIDVGVVLEGKVVLGNGVKVGPYCHIKDATIGDEVRIASHTVIDQAQIGAGGIIGPFARIRPETVLAEGAHIGNFVEIKKTRVGKGSKINHLSYVGDSEVGSEVNIGAGTITCNYDGVNKHKTIIGDGAFIGSDTQLVAPVTVGAGATIGAGSTITKDTEANKLTLSRAKQITLEGWKRPEKKK